MQDNKIHFIAWLSESKSKSNISSCVDCLEKSSLYAIEKNITKESFWCIDEVRIFNTIRSKLLSNKIFKFYSKANFKMFIVAGKLYSEFLKSTPLNKSPYLHEALIEYDNVAAEDAAIFELDNKGDPTDIFYSVGDIEEALVAFKKWFVNKGRANSTARSYVNSVKSMINHFQDEWSKSTTEIKLVDCIRIFMGLLCDNKRFIDSNKRMHNQFTASLNSFVQFLTNVSCSKSTEKQSVKEERAKKYTIADAIVNVLKLRQPLTIKEIYDDIVRYTLYEFGAKNPLVAVRTTLLRQCINYHSDKRTLKTKLFFQARKNNKVVFSLINEHQMAVDQSKYDSQEHKVSLLNWDESLDYTRTKPTEIVIFARKIYSKNWADALVKICAELHAKYPNADFLGFTRPNLRRVFSQTGEEFISPKNVAPMLFVETNFECNRIISMIKELANYLSFDVNNIHIHYTKAERKEFTKAARATNPLKIVDAETSNILSMLNKHFVNGYTLGFIAAEKLRRFYNTAFNNDIQLSNDEINSLIEKHAFTYDSKKYYLIESIIPTDVLNQIVDYIDERFYNGAKYIFYTNLYDELSASYSLGKVFNADCLKKILKFSFATKYKFKASSFYPLEYKLSVKAEQITAIKNILLMNSAPVNLDELAELMPQIPKSSIKFLLVSEDEFTYSEPNFFTHVSCIRIQKEDLEIASSIIDEAIIRKGYISKNEFLKRLEQQQNSLFSNNYLFSEHAIYNALSYHFKNEYSRQGIIISSAKNPKDSTSILIDFLGDRDEVTISEIKEEAENIGKQLSCSRLNEVSINFFRVSRNKLVNKRLVQFDVAATDAVISGFCANDFIPIASIDFFSLFPRVISQKVVPWNSFLLNEYVRTESENFKCITNSSSLDKTIGVIVRKASKIEDYNEVLAIILGRATDVDLENKEEVIEYLLEQKLIASKKLSNIDSIVLSALKQREAR